MEAVVGEELRPCVKQSIYISRQEVQRADRTGPTSKVTHYEVEHRGWYARLALAFGKVYLFFVFRPIPTISTLEVRKNLFSQQVFWEGEAPAEPDRDRARQEPRPPVWLRPKAALRLRPAA